MKIDSISLLINQINSCLEHNEIPAAFYMSLTLPDVCGLLEFPGLKPSERYIKWFDEHIGQYEQSPLAKEDPSWAEMPYMSGERMYKIRNGLLHACTNDLGEQFKLDEFLFIWQGALETGGIKRDQNGKETKYWHVNVLMIIKKMIWTTEHFIKNGNYDKSKLPTISEYGIENIPDVFKI